MTGVVELTMTDDLTTVRPAAGGRLDEVTVRALDLVVDAHGDLDVWYAVGTGALEGRREAVVRFAARAGVDLVADHDLDAALVAVPAPEAVELCRAYCRRQRANGHGRLRCRPADKNPQLSVRWRHLPR